MIHYSPLVWLEGNLSLVLREITRNHHILAWCLTVVTVSEMMASIHDCVYIYDDSRQKTYILKDQLVMDRSKTKVPMKVLSDVGGL